MFQLPKRYESNEDDEMADIHTQAHSLNIVTPGELITSDPAFMRGHGTYALASLTSSNSSSGHNNDESDHQQQQQQQQHLIASVAGVVERVNKLISVRPIRSRYLFGKLLHHT